MHESNSNRPSVKNVAQRLQSDSSQCLAPTGGLRNSACYVLPLRKPPPSSAPVCLMRTSDRSARLYVVQLQACFWLDENGKPQSSEFITSPTLDVLRE